MLHIMGFSSEAYSEYLGKPAGNFGQYVGIFHQFDVEGFGVLFNFVGGGFFRPVIGYRGGADEDIAACNVLSPIPVVLSRMPPGLSSIPVRWILAKG